MLGLLATLDLMDPEETLVIQDRREPVDPMATKEHKVKMAFQGNRDLREPRGRRENLEKR